MRNGEPSTAAAAPVQKKVSWKMSNDNVAIEAAEPSSPKSNGGAGITLQDIDAGEHTFACTLCMHTRA